MKLPGKEAEESGEAISPHSPSRKLREFCNWATGDETLPKSLGEEDMQLYLPSARGDANPDTLSAAMSAGPLRETGKRVN